MSNNVDQEKLVSELSSFKGQWFVVNCITNTEDRIKDDLLQKVKSNNLSDKIFEIRVTRAGDASGKKGMSNKFPGYIFINMEMTDETWYVVRNTPGVTGFIGSSGKGTKPFPLTTEEVSSMILNANLKAEKSMRKANFSINDVVEIGAGSFNGYKGRVIQIDENKGVATVEVEFLGRITPTELSFDDIEGTN